MHDKNNNLNNQILRIPAGVELNNWLFSMAKEFNSIVRTKNWRSKTKRFVP